MLSQIQRLLLCPLCRQPLANPTTLHCGHSLCSSHLTAASSSCPVPACADRPPPDNTPRIPPSSRVRYHPAPHPQLPRPDVPTARSDVVLNNILRLIARTAPANPRIRDQPDEDNDDDDPDDQPRPRKRHKYSHTDDIQSQDDDDQVDLLSHLRATAASDRLVPPHLPLDSRPVPRDPLLQDFDKKLLDELTCHICYLLFYQPVTTPCQHTFCVKCLQRSLDHSTTCPICRHELPSTYFQDQPLNNTLLSIILKAYPLLYQERGDAIEQEERHARLNTPIFVCTLAFPGVPTLIHFFEPRYRLMLRRCLESPHPRFGMIMSPKPGSPQTQYGTMLEIRSVQMLPDGRSMVETMGSTRFRILERGTLDGYMVGRVERIDDYPDNLLEPPVDPIPAPSSSSAATSSSSSSASDDTPSTPPPPPPPPFPRQTHPSNAELIETCKSFLDRLQRGAAPWVVQRLSSTYGAMPSDPALFSFWVALVLPIEEDEKSKLLPIRSARMRLMLVVYWIEQLNNNWYAWMLHSLVRCLCALGSWASGDDDYWNRDWLGVRGPRPRPREGAMRMGRGISPSVWAFPLFMLLIWCCWSVV